MYKILALSRDQSHHYSFLKEEKSFEVIETDIYNPKMIQKIKPDILITLSCDYYQVENCIKYSKANSIPTLYIMDGMIDWLHRWENPKFGSGGGIPYQQIINIDKIACIGWESARTLESWGNIGKCEIIGSPRFDKLILDSRNKRIQTLDKKNILIMTANTPAFNIAHEKKVIESLIDMEKYLDSQNIWNPIWRIGKNLNLNELSYNYSFKINNSNNSLHEDFQKADAVLSTPSTVMLESMLMNIPTAVLDYTNSPHYVNAAWRILSKKHIKETMKELAEPTEKKLIFQYNSLHNCLECLTPSTPRMIMLIKKMIEINKECIGKDVITKYPHKIIISKNFESLVPSKEFSFEKLYPDHYIFQNNDIIELQKKLIYKEQEIKAINRELKLLKLKGIFATIIRKILRKDN